MRVAPEDSALKVVELTMSALQSSAGEGAFSQYGSALASACLSWPPPFGSHWYGEKYRDVASDPVWLAGSLVANAEKEGDGSRSLWALAGRVENDEHAELIRQHAIDESRHSLMYLSLLDLVFPDAADADLRSSLRELSPHYQQSEFPEKGSLMGEDAVLDEIIQMNFGEIRTRIHQLLMRPVLMAIAPDETKDRVGRILDSLMSDETAHVMYTAGLIEKALSRGMNAFVRDVMAARLNEFNELTLREVGELRFAGE